MTMECLCSACICAVLMSGGDLPILVPSHTSVHRHPLFHLPLFSHLQLCLCKFVISLSHTHAHTHMRILNMFLSHSLSLHFLLPSSHSNLHPHHTIISYQRFQRPEHSPEHHTRTPEDQCSVRCIRCFHGQDKYACALICAINRLTADWRRNRQSDNSLSQCLTHRHTD